MRAQCSHASVGLAQARPNYDTVKPYTLSPHNDDEYTMNKHMRLNFSDSDEEHVDIIVSSGKH